MQTGGPLRYFPSSLPFRTTRHDVRIFQMPCDRMILIKVYFLIYIYFFFLTSLLCIQLSNSGGPNHEKRITSYVDPLLWLEGFQGMISARIMFICRRET